MSTRKKSTSTDQEEMTPIIIPNFSIYDEWTLAISRMQAPSFLMAFFEEPYYYTLEDLNKESEAPTETNHE